MSARYFIPEDQKFLHENRAVLQGSEVVHLIRVMRAKVGDIVLLFDGQGVEYPSRITRIGKSNAELEILEYRYVNNEPEIDLTIACPLPKGDRQKWMIEKLTELGVRRYIPLKTIRSDIEITPNVLKRLERQVLEASKQCGRAKFMKIYSEMSFDQLAQEFPFQDQTDEISFLKEEPKESKTLSPTPERGLKLIAHPISDSQVGQRSFRDFIKVYSQNPSEFPKKILVTIGPVGGFADEEIQSATNNDWLPIDLGKQVYRVETAAIVAASLFIHLGD